MAMRGRAPAEDIGLEVDMDFILKREAAINKSAGPSGEKTVHVFVKFIRKFSVFVL